MRFVPILVIAALVAAEPRAQETGAQLYQSNCAGCHGLDGRGGEHAPNIATVPRLQQMSDAELVGAVRGGVPAADMPAFGSRLNTGQISAVVSYLRTLQGKRNTRPLPGNPETGRTLFFNKGGCSECHMVAGKGGFIAEDLSFYASAHSLDQIRDAIVNPNRDFDPNHAAAAVITLDGQRYTGLVRNEDNFSLQLQARDGGFHLFEKSDVASITREKASLMPADYGSRLTSTELNDLISYLVRTAGRQPKQPPDDSEW